MEQFIICEGSKSVTLNDEYPSVTMLTKDYMKIKSQSKNGTYFMRGLLNHFFPVEKLTSSNREKLESKQNDDYKIIESLYGNNF